MKRITRSLLSLCLAFVLCAALLPNTNVAKANVGSKPEEETSVPQTKEPTFLITGYEASRSSIETGDTVSITVYLSRTDGRSDKIRVVRSLDSFQGGTADTITTGSYGSYVVTFKDLVYTGDTNKALNFTIYYDGAKDADGNDIVKGGYQPDNNVAPIRECVPYTEPKPEPEPTPETIPVPRAVFNSDGMSSPFTFRTPAPPPCATPF